MIASVDANLFGERENSPYTGPTSGVIPEAAKHMSAERSNTGVSTDNVLPPKHMKKGKRCWYALRTTYGREKKAYEYIVAHKGTAFYPTIRIEKTVNGKKRLVDVSRIPNVFFAYGTEEDIKGFVYDNVNLPFLRFYYQHIHFGARLEKIPMIVPESQMESLKIICNAEKTSDVLLINEEIKKFRSGEKVRVVKGDFEGVVGRVARFHGQQRVGIVIDGLITAVTAYVPSAFLVKY